jgi:ADP-ribosyl-[dinitrogen reductase] hydrolase
LNSLFTSKVIALHCCDVFYATANKAGRIIRGDIVPPKLRQIHTHSLARLSLVWYASDRKEMTMELRDQYRGSLLGLAVGDALGTTLEFSPPGSFAPLEDMVGGGPFALKPGEWTDDTSMALCLTASLIERQGFDACDQMQRYLRWRNEGYMSSIGTCFDIGGTVSSSLSQFEATGEPFAGSTHLRAAGNGSIMRLAPVPLFYARQPQEALEKSADSSRTTHGAQTAVDACRYLGALLVGAVHGASKEELLSPSYSPVPNYWQQHPLVSEIAEIAAGSFKQRQPPEIRGTGYVVASLEAALWAFYHSTSFQQGCLLAVNLGDDADTTGAVYGQLAGAFYGEPALPQHWRTRLAHRSLIEALADQLFDLSRMADAERDLPS